MGFYNPDHETAKAVEAEMGIPCFESVDALIDAVDVVDIVTPTIQHFACASEALKRLMHVFIEKPIVATPDEAKALIKLAKDVNVKVQVGDCSRHGCMAFDRKLPGKYFYLLGGSDFPTTGKTGLGITRIDENGNAIWERIVGNEDRDFWYMISGIATNDGGALGFANPCFSGGDISHAYGGIDGWLIKLDSLGNTEWDVILGADRTDMVYGLCETSDEGFLAFMKSTAGAMPGSIEPCKPATNWRDAVLVKLRKNGEIERNRCYGGTEAENFCAGIETNDGYLMAGCSASEDGDLEGAGYHLGYNHNGTHQKTVDVWLLRLDFDGNVVWSRCYGGSKNDIPIKVFQNEDGGFTVFANSLSLDGDVQSTSHWVLPTGAHESGNWWIFRTDSEGNLLWERALGSRSGSREELRDVVKHNDKEYTVAGYAPNFSENEWPYYHGDINCSNSTLIYSPSDAVYWIVHIRDVFDYNAVEENHTQKKQFLKVYPNPAQTRVVFSYTLPEDASSATVTVTDMLGTTVGRFETGSAAGEYVWNCTDVKPGVYYYAIVCDGLTRTGKLVITQ